MNKHDIAQNSNLEEKILNELQKNCRLNLDEIGKKCGCSRYKVARIMKKLEEEGIIVGYSAVVNPTKTKFKYFILLVKRTSQPFDEEMINNIPIMRETDFVPVVNIKSIATLYVHGNYDWILTFTAPDIADAKEFYNKIFKYYNKYIENLELLEIVLPFRMHGFVMAPDEEIKNFTKIL
ncbi:MAG: Lrp/AsnC family transcriptional regulator [Thermoplasmatales archaeon]|nr:MAG: Lrp/AsnC family transcriptional regulator [Thermoplasmatales archaeon]